MRHGNKEKLENGLRHVASHYEIRDYSKRVKSDNTMLVIYGLAAVMLFIMALFAVC